MSDKQIIRQHKYDITRLKNLLRNYRDSMITNRMNSLTHLEPVYIINQVDRAIEIITSSLR